MNGDQINTVRRFNRSVSQRIGALDDSYLDRGRPLGEARLLFEIGRDGTDLRELRARLGLDSGYLSRLIRSLEKQGLVEARAAAADGRVRRLRLTTTGRREVAEYDRLSDAFAESVLAPLGPTQKDRLVDAMAEVERLMRAMAVRFREEPADSNDARICLGAYYAELATRFDTGYDPAQGLPLTADEMSPPRGTFVLARLDGRAVGCLGLKFKDGGVGEVKRMWVAPDLRGLGVGRRLLGTIEGIARDRGVTALQLDTNRTLKEAHALYRSQGFVEIPPFNDEPYAHHWFEKNLA